MTGKSGKPANRRTVARRSQTERVALSDQLIIAATISLLVEKGVEASTLQAIAAQAGYNHTLLVHRYGSKLGLLMRVMDRVTVDWHTLVARHVGERQGIEALCALLDAHIAFIKTEPDEIMAMYRLWFHGAAPGDEYRKRLAIIHRAQREAVTGWLRSGLQRGELNLPCSPRTFAERFSATISGFMYQWLTDPELSIVASFRSLQRSLRNEYGKVQAPKTTITSKATGA